MGANIPNPGRIRDLHKLLQECCLSDLECKGPRFTWRNNKSNGDFIMERIDMGFANVNWRETFDKALIFVEVAVGSDHNPLLLDTDFSLKKVIRQFRFESLWTIEEDCKCIVSEVWA